MTREDENLESYQSICHGSESKEGVRETHVQVEGIRIPRAAQSKYWLKSENMYCTGRLREGKGFRLSSSKRASIFSTGIKHYILCEASSSFRHVGIKNHRYQLHGEHPTQKTSDSGRNVSGVKPPSASERYPTSLRWNHTACVPQYRTNFKVSMEYTLTYLPQAASKLS